MLVLMRKENERIFIDDGRDRIVVTLLRCNGHQARIGIQAPRECRVLREEVARRIEAGEPEAGNGGTPP